MTDQLDRYCDGPADWPIAVTLSGGSDSHALLRLAALWARSRGRSLIALTVDHQLNPSSAQWTRQAANMAASVDVPWQGLAWTDSNKPSRGLQAAARAARYGLLSDAARTAGARVLLIGHTRDDALENALMRATDTPGIGGLYSWRPVPIWPEGRGLMLCRPMLELRRAALRDWLRTKGLSWIEDPANANPAYARVRARQALKASDNVISDPGVRVLDGADWLKAVTIDVSGAMTLPRSHVDAVLSALGTGAALRALSALILCVSGQSTPPRHAGLEPLLDLLRSVGSEAVRTLGGVQITLTPTTFQLCREFGRIRPAPLRVQAGVAVIWDGRLWVKASVAGTVVPGIGRLGSLSPNEKAHLRQLSPMARLSLPVLLPDGGGAALLPDIRPLGLERLRASLGGIRRESDVWPPDTD